LPEPLLLLESYLLAVAVYSTAVLMVCSLIDLAAKVLTVLKIALSLAVTGAVSLALMVAVSLALMVAVSLAVKVVWNLAVMAERSSVAWALKVEWVASSFEALHNQPSIVKCRDLETPLYTY
jgi:hypothetical protein